MEPLSLTIQPLYVGFCVGSLFGVGITFGLVYLLGSFAKKKEERDRQ